MCKFLEASALTILVFARKYAVLIENSERSNLMKKPAHSLLLIFSFAAFSAVVSADDMEGRIEFINPENLSFGVQGIEFFTTPSTDYDDGLHHFDDLAKGQKVEVDFIYREGRHYATEIELDD